MNRQDYGPLAPLAALVGFVAHYLGAFAPVVELAYSTVPSWYPALAISSSTIIPTLGPATMTLPFVGAFEPAGVAQGAALIGAVIYVGYLGDRIVSKASKRSDNK